MEHLAAVFVDGARMFTEGAVLFLGAMSVVAVIGFVALGLVTLWGRIR